MRLMTVAIRLQPMLTLGLFLPRTLSENQPSLPGSANTITDDWIAKRRGQEDHGAPDYGYGDPPSYGDRSSSQSPDEPPSSELLSATNTAILHSSDAAISTYGTVGSDTTASTGRSESTTLTTLDTNNHGTVEQPTGTEDSSWESVGYTFPAPLTSASSFDTFSTIQSAVTLTTSTPSNNTRVSWQISSTTQPGSRSASNGSITSSIRHSAISTVSSSRGMPQNLTNTVITLTRHWTTTIRSSSLSDIFESSVLPVTGSLPITNSSISTQRPTVPMPTFAHSSRYWNSSSHTGARSKVASSIDVNALTVTGPGNISYSYSTIQSPFPRPSNSSRISIYSSSSKPPWISSSVLATAITESTSKPAKTRVNSISKHDNVSWPNSTLTDPTIHSLTSDVLGTVTRTPVKSSRLNTTSTSSSQNVAHKGPFRPTTNRTNRKSTIMITGIPSFSSVTTNPGPVITSTGIGNSSITTIWAGWNTSSTISHSGRSGTGLITEPSVAGSIIATHRRPTLTRATEPSGRTNVTKSTHHRSNLPGTRSDENANLTSIVTLTRVITTQLAHWSSSQSVSGHDEGSSANVTRATSPISSIPGLPRWTNTSNTASLSTKYTANSTDTDLLTQITLPTWSKTGFPASTQLMSETTLWPPEASNSTQLSYLTASSSKILPTESRGEYSKSTLSHRWSANRTTSAADGDCDHAQAKTSTSLDFSAVPASCTTLISNSIRVTRCWAVPLSTHDPTNPDIGKPPAPSTLITSLKGKAQMPPNSEASDVPYSKSSTTPSPAKLPDNPNYPWGGGSPIHRHQNVAHLTDGGFRRRTKARWRSLVDRVRIMLD